MFKRFFSSKKSAAAEELSAALTEIAESRVPALSESSKKSRAPANSLQTPQPAENPKNLPGTASASAESIITETPIQDAILPAAQSPEPQNQASLVMPMPISPPQPLVEVPNRKLKHSDFDENSIKTYSELVSAINSEKLQLTLANNIIVPKNLIIRHDLVINFNGFSLISEESTPDARVLDIRSGEVSLIGKGNIFAMGKRSIAIRIFGAISSSMPAYSTLTIDEGISVFAPAGYGIAVSPNLGAAYGVKIKLSGRLFAHDCIVLSESIRGDKPNVPLICINDGAALVADETAGCAISALGQGVWQIAAAKLTAAVGVTAKSGSLSFTHAKITARGANSPVFSLKPSDAKSLEISTSGGLFISEQGPIVSGSSRPLKSFRIESGEFCNPGQFAPSKLKSLLTISKETTIRHDISKFIQKTPPVPSPVAPSQTTSKPASVPKLSPKSLQKPSEQSSVKSSLAIAQNLHMSEMRSTLMEILADVEKMHRTDYDDSFETLQQAAISAKTTLKKHEVTIQEIRDLSKSLLAAIDNLRPLPRSEAIPQNSPSEPPKTPKKNNNIPLLSSYDPLPTLAPTIAATNFATTQAANPALGSVGQQILSITQLPTAFSTPNYFAIPLKLPSPCEFRLAASAIDELSPLSFWSTGLSVVDEFSPSPSSVPCLASKNPLAHLQTRLKSTLAAANAFLGRLKSSLAAGVSASVATYRDAKSSDK